MATSVLEFLITAKDEASEVFDKVSEAADTEGGKFDKIKAAATVGLAAAGAAAVKFGKDSIDAYADAQQSQAQLQAAFDQFPKLADTNISKLGDLDTAIQRKTGIDDDSIASGQAVLAQFDLTGKQIEQVTPLLADYAAKTGKDMPTAAKALGLALEGNTRGLKAIGITLPAVGSATAAVTKAQNDLAAAQDNLKSKQQALADLQARQAGKATLTVSDQQKLRDATQAVADAQSKAQDAAGKLASAQADASSKGSTFDQVMDGLNKKVGGFADKEGKTAAGQADILKSEFGNLEETAGSVLTPALTTLTSALADVFKWMNDNQGATAAIAGVVGGLAVAIGAYTAAQKIATVVSEAAAAAQELWDAAMNDNPIGIVITAIAALIAIIVLLVTHWSDVEAAGVAAWNWIKNAWSSAGDWFAGIGHDITGAFSSAWSGVKSAWGGVTDWFSGVVAGIGRVFSGIGSAITAPFRAAVNGFRSVWNSTVGGWGFTVPGWIPAIGGDVFRIPKLATGGTIAHGGWAIVGERGPEIAWLPGGSHVYPHGTTPAGGGGLTRDDLAWLAAQIAHVVTATTDARTSVALQRLLEG